MNWSIFGPPQGVLTWSVLSYLAERGPLLTRRGTLDSHCQWSPFERERLGQEGVSLKSALQKKHLAWCLAGHSWTRCRAPWTTPPGGHLKGPAGRESLMWVMSAKKKKKHKPWRISLRKAVCLKHENCHLVTAEWGSIRSRMQLLHVHVELQQFQLARAELEESSINFFWVWNEEVLIHEWNLMHVCRNVAPRDLHLFASDGWKGWMWYYKDMRPKCFCWTAGSPKPKRNFKRTICKNVKTRPTEGRADPSIHTVLVLIEYLLLHGRMSYFQQNRLGFTL